MNSAPRATIIISSKNRADDLRRTVTSSLQQSVNLEVLVLDDGSTDDTSDVIRNEFPHVKLHRFEQSLGYIVRRNQGASLASAPIVFSIDDDAIFSSPL